MRKSYRIKREDEFQDVFDNGQSVANRNFVIYYLDRPEAKHFRVGISVGKKIGHRANVRNRIKRYIRQSLLELKPHIDPHMDFLVIARKGASQLDMAASKKNMVHALSLAGILPRDTQAEDVQK
ncbi:ribonuclease P protein component [Lacticaseibacillus pabuli]|uniref:Ribonuclease P protein component n=1 Tax=Lacticaseibacillus pabuli TaxID=3025672 RepID=A0ABY7WXI8_9LACO|nr:ribonuclease P protein component [Lacticaseibacillus sp. KACC 23028]WDF83855.1 ribonuclease P protein component [Lacticaseibacillus sp. KACC 23028]